MIVRVRTHTTPDAPPVVVEVEVADPRAHMADLAAALGWHSRVEVDGAFVADDAEIGTTLRPGASLVEAAAVNASRGVRHANRSADTGVLVAGLDAGRPSTRPAQVLGDASREVTFDATSAVRSDPGAPHPHAGSISRSGLGPVAADGRRPVLRPALAMPGTTPSQEIVRPHVEQAPDPTPISWAPLVVPMVAGIGMGALIDPRLAAFALVGPAVSLGSLVEDRRRVRRGKLRAATSLAEERARLCVEVEAVATGLVRQARDEHPDAGDVDAAFSDASRPGALVWHRRPSSRRFGCVTVGFGRIDVDAPVESGGAVPPSRWSPGPVALAGVPIVVSLAPGWLGIAGPPEVRRAVARWVVAQLAAWHGPSDLGLAAVVEPDGAAGRAWEHLAWLPHTGTASVGGACALGTVGAASADAIIRAAARDARMCVVVIDGPDPMRVDLSLPATGIVLATRADDLPARCATVVVVDDSGHLVALQSPGPVDGAETILPGLATGISISTADRWARRQAAWSDPEQRAASALSSDVRLLGLLGLDDPTPSGVRDRWAAALGPITPLGMTAGPAGPVPLVVDLVADGPHALVAGTTGAGKSELLRTLVAGLAATESVDRCTFLLVDYKGGAAFDACAALPHVVGVVTDLAPDDASRALASLHAELRRREELLAQTGARAIEELASDEQGWWPMARLVIVVDEFATLAREHPSFVDGLVGVAQRGRSLGVHLVLGTQHPGSTITDQIRANTNLRIALRVQAAADSIDVVGTGAAATIDRACPGRGVLRAGADDAREFQGALATAAAPSACARVTVRAVDAFEPQALIAATGDTDLGALVGAIRAAAASLGAPPPTKPWLDPLPSQIDLGQLERQAPSARAVLGPVPLGMIDDPDRRWQGPLLWDPTAGGVLFAGVVGSGTTTAAHTAALAVVASVPPDAVHIVAIDGGPTGPGGLGVLQSLPHCAGIVRPAERERLMRLIGSLVTRMDAGAVGQGGTGSWSAPNVVLIIDGLAALRRELSDLAGLELMDDLGRIVAEGPGAGIACIIAADRFATVPSAWLGGLGCRVALRLADRNDELAAGIVTTSSGPAPPGRGRLVGRGSATPGMGATPHPLVVQLARPVGVAPMTAGGDLTGGPRPIAVLGDDIALCDVMGARPLRVALRPGEDHVLPLVIGRRSLDLGPAVVDLPLAAASLVVGPARSGRSSTLATLVRSAAAAHPMLRMVALSLRPSALNVAIAEAGGVVVGDAGALEAALVAEARALVLVDDAELIEDIPGGVLAGLARGQHRGVALVVAGRADLLASAYGHWTQAARRPRVGLALRPTSDLDLALLGAALLPRTPVPLARPGRGVLVVDGVIDVVQVAR